MDDLFSRSQAGYPDHWLRGKNIPVALRYGVAPRTIRDIWNRKTWAYATQWLWHLEDKFSSKPLESRGSASAQVRD